VRVPDRRPDAELPVVAVRFMSGRPKVREVPWMASYMRRLDRMTS
jgi:hypothetical protein